jgi:hypothetical protein
MIWHYDCILSSIKRRRQPKYGWKQNWQGLKLVSQSQAVEIGGVYCPFLHIGAQTIHLLMSSVHGSLLLLDTDSGQRGESNLFPPKICNFNISSALCAAIFFQKP